MTHFLKQIKTFYKVQKGQKCSGVHHVFYCSNADSVEKQMAQIADSTPGYTLSLLIILFTEGLLILISWIKDAVVQARHSSQWEVGMYFLLMELFWHLLLMFKLIL